MARNNNGKTKLEILELLIDKVTELVTATTPDRIPANKEYQNSLIKAYQGVPECSIALLNPPASYNALCAQLQNSSTSRSTPQRKTTTAATMKCFICGKIGY
ncbi:hypothetical protein LX36DRAFT_717463 [Colletotrichum falcatum]|nr:hypothetical protein LX36DRAFT_717463 [Colletotrichum falcatum]